MPTIDENLRKRLVAKYGPDINFETSSTLIAELLQEVVQQPGGLLGASYDKTYGEGYNKIDYSRADYNRYDKTYEKATDPNQGFIDRIINEVRPESEQIILTKLRRTPPT